MSDSGEVVVFPETPSLATTLTEFLVGEGISAVLADAASTGSVPSSAVLLISTCSGYRCAQVARWRAGEFPGTEMIAIGSRDPSVRTGNGLHCVELPLRPGELLTLIQSTLERRRAASLVAATPSESS